MSDVVPTDAGLDDLIPAYLDGVLQPLGKLDVHRRGLRHPAISVFIMADDGSDRTLIQRRAAGKYHTPKMWANACCTHPHWGEDAHSAATRRVGQELGLTGLPLTLAGGQEYRADVGSALTEHEVVDIFVGHLSPAAPVPFNPAEVMAVEWVTLPDLAARIAANPQDYTPWLQIYLAKGWGEIALRPSPQSAA
jgi:isopentenyl-diphosphate delta-isomerase